MAPAQTPPNPQGAEPLLPSPPRWKPEKTAGGTGQAKKQAAKRTAASPKRIAEIRAKKLADGCRLCGKHPASAHHIIPRSSGGVWTEANIYPLCGSGTTGCHGLIEARDKPATHLFRALLTDLEYAYVVTKRGEGWLDRRYPAIWEGVA